MLVSAKEMLTKAKAGHYAVGQFNINNLEWTKAILLTAQELNSPVILGVSEGAGKYMCGYKTIVGMVNGMLEELKITVPVALHLDHGSYEGAKACIEAGFSSIMFDGSHYPIEENIEKTKELVAIAESKGMSVEAEVGSIGGEEDGVIGAGEVADPDECKMIADLGVTMLAAGIGNIHGKYPENWPGLRFDALDAIQQKTGAMPLVLHGGTGIPADMIKMISSGLFYNDLDRLVTLLEVLCTFDLNADLVSAFLDTLHQSNNTLLAYFDPLFSFFAFNLKAFYFSIRFHFQFDLHGFFL